MIVIARSYGQLGNRLFLYAHMIAAARHHGVELANPCFAEYAGLFPATAADPWCRYPARVPTDSPEPSTRRREWLARGAYLAARAIGLAAPSALPVATIRVRGDQRCDLAGEEFGELVRANRYLFTQGWLFRSNNLLANHVDAVRDHFRIGAPHRAKVDETITRIRRRADVVVGVHVRHGDYATYLGGKYYYSTRQYAAAMRSVVEQLPGRRVAFLVCSNSVLEQSEFRGLNVQLGPGHLLEDLYCFAETDLLIGPPSTFTGWASFYGDVPLVAMEQADVPIVLPSTLGRHAA